MLKKELIGLLICTLLITVAVAPGINALTINRDKVDEVNVIHQRVDSDTQHQDSTGESTSPTNRGGLADNVPITCHGPYWIDIITRQWVFGIKLINNNDVPINFIMLVDVTKRDGTILFDCSPVILQYPFKNGTLGHVQLVLFRQFREKRHLFGFFDVHVDFTVFEDGSSKKKVFHGLIFGISAVIFDTEGEIVE